MLVHVKMYESGCFPLSNHQDLHFSILHFFCQLNVILKVMKILSMLDFIFLLKVSKNVSIEILNDL